MAIYLATKIDPKMFSNLTNIQHQIVTPAMLSLMVKPSTICISDEAMIIDAISTRYGIKVKRNEQIIPELKPGDTLLVATCSGLPVLNFRKEYTPDECKKANFTFHMFSS